MQLLDAGNQLSSRPSPNATVSPGWANNDVSGSAPATIADPDCWNAIMAELANVVAATGGTLSKTNVSQVLTSIQALIATGAPGGGYLNKLRNSTCLVASRGTSGTVSAGSAAYTLDGHYLAATGAGLAWSQVAGIGYAEKSLQLSCASGLTDAVWSQPVHGSGAAPLAGQNVTLQFRMKNSSGGSITPKLTVKHLNASDVGVYGPWTGVSPAANTTDLSAASLSPVANGATQVESYTFACSAAAGNGLLVSVDFGAGLNAASGSVIIGDFDLRATPNLSTGVPAVTPPLPELRDIVAEILECFHYLPALSSGGVSGNSFLGIAGCFSGGSPNAFVGWQFPVPTRVPVTGLYVSSPSHFILSNAAAGGTTLSSLVLISDTTVLGAELGPNASSTSSLSAGDAVLFGTTSASALMYLTGAEL